MKASTVTIALFALSSVSSNTPFVIEPLQTDCYMRGTALTSDQGKVPDEDETIFALTGITNDPYRLHDAAPTVLREPGPPCLPDPIPFFSLFRADRGTI